MLNELGEGMNKQFWEILKQNDFTIHAVSIACCILLYLLTFVIFKKNHHKVSFGLETKTMRIAILVYGGLQLIDLLLIGEYPLFSQILVQLGQSFLTIYVMIVIYHFWNEWTDRRFGTEKQVDGKKGYAATYNSRLADITGVVVLTLFTIYFLIEIWNLNSLLETTSFLGIIFAFLALTNGIWAPDIYYGIIILNSKLLSDGDTIQLGDDPDLYMINRVTFVYTVLINVKNNHLSMIRNSQLINHRIENLTRRSSSKGLRLQLIYKVGYPDFSEVSDKNREAAWSHYINRVDKMFSQVQEKIYESDKVHVIKM